MLKQLKQKIVIFIGKIHLRFSKVKVGKNIQIMGKVMFRGNGIEFGCDNLIKSGKKYNPVGCETPTCFVCEDNARIIVGNGVGISNSIFVAKTLIVIEDDVFIGGGCRFYDNDFHSLNYDKRLSIIDDDIKSSPIYIKRGAFIGTDTIVLKGVTIGEKSVVGAKSLVTKSIPPGELWGGVPARYIKSLNS